MDQTYDGQIAQLEAQLKEAELELTNVKDERQDLQQHFKVTNHIKKGGKVMAEEQLFAFDTGAGNKLKLL